MNTSLTSHDLQNVSPILIVPVGSFEQHGPHLPLDTDTRIAVAVVEEVAQRHRDLSLVVAPAIAYSASDEHAGFAGTLSTGTEAFTASAIALARSAKWARGIIFANGHGGNADALRTITETLTADGIAHNIWSPPFVDGDDAHAGKTETSLMLHISPEDVRVDELSIGNTTDVKELLPMMRGSGVIAVSNSGVLGDATQASKALGAEIFERYCVSFSHLLQHTAIKWPQH